MFSKQIIVIFYLLVNPLTFMVAVRLFDSTRVYNELESIQHKITIYEKDHKNLPPNLIELTDSVETARLYRAALLFDPFGQAYDYHPFSGGYYLLRSFGGDRDSTTPLRAPDPYLARLRDLPNVRHTSQNFQSRKLQKPHFPPLPLLSHVVSPDGRFIAEKYYPASDTAKFGQLVVRRTNDPQKQSLLISGHKNITEFLWLANSKSLVYINEERESGLAGLYIWNIYSNESNRVTLPTLTLSGSTSAAGANPTEGNDPTLSLAGISEDHDILLQVIPAALKELTLQELQSGKFLHTISWVDKNKQFEAMRREAYLISDKKNYLTAGLSHDPLQTMLERSWVELQTSGKFGRLLDTWQNFSLRQNDLVATAYSLCLLVQLYRDASLIYRDKNPAEAHFLRTYGHKLADQLLSFKVLPSLSQRLGLNLRRDLGSPQALNLSAKETYFEPLYERFRK